VVRTWVKYVGEIRPAVRPHGKLQVFRPIRHYGGRFYRYFFFILRLFRQFSSPFAKQIKKWHSQKKCHQLLFTFCRLANGEDALHTVCPWLGVGGSRLRVGSVCLHLFSSLAHVFPAFFGGNVFVCTCY